MCHTSNPTRRVRTLEVGSPNTLANYSFNSSWRQATFTAMYYIVSAACAYKTRILCAYNRAKCWCKMRANWTNVIREAHEDYSLLINDVNCWTDGLNSSTNQLLSVKQGAVNKSKENPSSVSQLIISCPRQEEWTFKTPTLKLQH